MICKLCNKDFDYKSGHFVRHLMSDHSFNKRRVYGGNLVINAKRKSVEYVGKKYVLILDKKT